MPAYLAGGGAAVNVGSSPEDLVNALVPFAWWRPDSGITLNGSNVSAWLDRTGTQTISQATALNQPPYLSSVSELGNLPAVRFSSTWLISTSPASAWKFLHDGTGMEVFYVFVARANGTTQHCLASTSDHGVSIGYSSLLYDDISGGTLDAITYVVGNGTIRSVDYQGTIPSASMEPGEKHFVNSHNGSAASPNWGHRLDGSSLATGSYGAAPSSSNSANTLNVGRGATGGQAGKQDLADLIFFDKVLSTDERAVVVSYLESRYGAFAA